jgi:hypothetical protein
MSIDNLWKWINEEIIKGSNGFIFGGKKYLFIKNGDKVIGWTEDTDYKKECPAIRRAIKKQ